MDGHPELSDPEFLYKLRLDYLRAMQTGDYTLINSVIIPQFRERFSKYYGEYEKSWKNPSVSRLPISVVIDPMQNRQAELDWMELVLKGQLEPFA
jgi:hypothetical protein